MIASTTLIVLLATLMQHNLLKQEIEAYHEVHVLVPSFDSFRGLVRFYGKERLCRAIFVDTKPVSVFSL